MPGKKARASGGDAEPLDRRLAAALAENERLRQELAVANQNIELLNQINRNMRATLRVEEVAHILLTAVTAGAGLGFNRAMLFLLDRAGQRLEGTMAVGPDSPESVKALYEDAATQRFGIDFYIREFYSREARVPSNLERAIRRIAVDAKGPGILPDVLRSSGARRFDAASGIDPGEAAALAPLLAPEFVAAPLRAGGEPIGVLIADNAHLGAPLTDELTWSFGNLADFGASLILAARRFQDAEERSIVDELTGLYNFRHLKEKLGEEAVRGKRYDRTFSVAILDIDHFKNFNDRNGHLLGNRALQEMAALIGRGIRSVDVAARYGGEEFVLVFPETDRAGALRATTKLLETVRATTFPGGENQPTGRVTFSAGVACFPEDAETAEGLLEAADRRLYLAKAEGRDRVRA